MSRTRLDAINMCMRGIGLSPVATEDDPDLDAALAGQTVDQITEDIQARGYWFNKEWNWFLTPNETTGFIDAPSSAISVITVGKSRSLPVTIRGGKLYDLLNHTYDLRILLEDMGGGDTIEFAFITSIPFDDMPPLARLSVTYTARRMFAQDLEVDERRWKFQMKDEETAFNAMLKEDARNVKRNYLRDNPRVSTFLSVVGGRNSLTGGVAIFPKRDTY